MGKAAHHLRRQVDPTGAGAFMTVEEVPTAGRGTWAGVSEDLPDPGGLDGTAPAVVST